MELLTITTVFFVLGVILIIAELIVPGGVVACLGVGAILIGLLRLTGILDNVFTSITLWFGISLATIVVVRPILLKKMGGETEVDNVDEDVDAYGHVIEVLEDVNESDTNGRIKFRGSSWPAISTEGCIRAGSKAKIVSRDNLAWIVEPDAMSNLGT